MALSKPKFLNWIKAALAVLFTKEEIEPVVYNEIAQFQQRCLQNISSLHGLPAGSNCSSCTTENVVKCPTNRICNVNRGKCSYHRNVTTKYRPTGCPKKICHEMKSEIQNAHRFVGPSYKNTDATQWCRNPWEIAKCFMPPDGYKDVMNAADTDFNGIISVILNYKGFEAKISDDLSKKDNIFDKGRDVGKAVRHSPNLEVEDADLIQFFTILNSILTDPGFISINKSQNNARQRLAKLQNDDLIIGKDVIRKVLEDVGKTIQEQIRNEMDEYKKKTEEQKLELIDIVQLKVKAIEDKGNVSLNQLNDALKLSVDAFDAKVQKAIQKIEVVAKKETENAIREIQNTVVKPGASTTMSQETYQKQKKELKRGLYEFYKTRHSKIFLSPLLEEKDTPLASFYIRPELNLIFSTKPGNDKKIPVKSLSEMFKSGDKDNREIYVLADAGLGKTAFSNYLANVWCQAHYPDTNMTECFDKDDIECMLEFDILFVVLLRDSGDLCSVDELISEKIVSNLGLEEKISEDVLLKILKNEKCLVILDGLDEWSHPEKKCYRSPRSIPHRNDREKCTVLTTTRPWKIGALNLNSRELGQKVELTKLSEDSANTLAKRIVQRLKPHPNNNALKREAKTFIKEVCSRNNAELASVPLLLIYTICLWCNGVPIGNSECDLYIKIVELLLSRTIQKHGELQQSWGPSDSDIPECFAEYENCMKYYPLVMCLGKIAYHTLFSETRENTLVFDGSLARKYLSTDEMKFTLHSGMLSESTYSSITLTKTLSKVSFSHKTVQEFFAAIFISSQSEAQKKVIEKCRDIQDILDMSKVFQFISKLNAYRMCAISNDFTSVINADKKTRDYRTRTSDVNRNDNPLYAIQNMFLSCLQEMPESENIQLCLQDVFIYKDTEHSKLLQRLLKQNKTNIKSLYINEKITSISLREKIDLFSLTNLSHIQKLYYNGNFENEAEINRILFPSLQVMTLFYGVWTKSGENLSKNLARLQNLQYLNIRNFTLSHKILETIFNCIPGQKSMKDLTLIGLQCEESSPFCNRLNLSKHSTLTKLRLEALPKLQLDITTPSLVNVALWRIDLDESSLLLSRDMLNIECVELGFTKMSAGSLQNLITVLENLPQSVTIKMRDIEPETEYERVRENIQRSQTFSVIPNDDWKIVSKTIKPNGNRQKQKHCEVN